MTPSERRKFWKWMDRNFEWTMTFVATLCATFVSCAVCVMTATDNHPGGLSAPTAAVISISPLLIMGAFKLSTAGVSSLNRRVVKWRRREYV